LGTAIALGVGGKNYFYHKTYSENIRRGRITGNFENLKLWHTTLKKMLATFPWEIFPAQGEFGK
jgi:hypothetical protein